MEEKRKKEEQISTLRDKLYDLIDRKDNLIDEEVVAMSQMLDHVLNTYYQQFCLSNK